MAGNRNLKRKAEEQPARECRACPLPSFVKNGYLAVEHHVKRVCLQVLHGREGEPDDEEDADSDYLPVCAGTAAAQQQQQQHGGDEPDEHPLSTDTTTAEQPEPQYGGDQPDYRAFSPDTTIERQRLQQRRAEQPLWFENMPRPPPASGADQASPAPVIMTRDSFSDDDPKALDNERKRSDKYMQECSKLKEEVNELKQSNKMHSQNSIYWEDAYNKKEAEYRESEADYALLKEHAEENIEIGTENQEALKKLGDENKELRERCEVLHGQVSSKMSEKVRNKEKLEAEKEQIRAEAGCFFNQQSSAHQANIKGLELHYGQLLEQAEQEKNNAATKHAEEIDAKNAELTELRQQLASQADTLKPMNTNATDKEERIEALALQVTVEQAACISKDADINERDTEIDRLRQQLKNQQAVSAPTPTVVNAINAQLNNHIEALRHQLNIANRAVEYYYHPQLIQQLEQRDQQLSVQDTQLKIQATQLQDLDTQLKGRDTQLMGRDNQSKIQEEQLKAQAEQLKAQAEQLKAQAEQLKAQEEQLKAQEEQMKAKEEQLKAAVDQNPVNWNFSPHQTSLDQAGFVEGWCQTHGMWWWECSCPPPISPAEEKQQDPLQQSQLANPQPYDPFNDAAQQAAMIQSDQSAPSLTIDPALLQQSQQGPPEQPQLEFAQPVQPDLSNQMDISIAPGAPLNTTQMDQQGPPSAFSQPSQQAPPPQMQMPANPSSSTTQTPPIDTAMGEVSAVSTIGQSNQSDLTEIASEDVQQAFDELDEADATTDPVRPRKIAPVRWRGPNSGGRTQNKTRPANIRNAATSSHPSQQLPNPFSFQGIPTGFPVLTNTIGGPSSETPQENKASSDETTKWDPFVEMERARVQTDQLYTQNPKERASRHPDLLIRCESTTAGPSTQSAQSMSNQQNNPATPAAGTANAGFPGHGNTASNAAAYQTPTLIPELGTLGPSSGTASMTKKEGKQPVNNQSNASQTINTAPSSRPSPSQTAQSTGEKSVMDVDINTSPIPSGVSVADTTPSERNGTRGFPAQTRPTRSSPLTQVQRADDNIANAAATRQNGHASLNSHTQENSQAHQNNHANENIDATMRNDADDSDDRLSELNDDDFDLADVSEATMNSFYK